MNPPKPNWYWTRSKFTFIFTPRWWNGKHWSYPAMASYDSESAAYWATERSTYANSEIKWKEIK